MIGQVLYILEAFILIVAYISGAVGFFRKDQFDMIFACFLLLLVAVSS